MSQFKVNRLAQSLSVQLSFEGFSLITDAVEQLASDSGIEKRGAIYTKREIVDLILDLVGYTVDQPLTSFRLLEPSFGNGGFMLPTVERLLTAAQREPDGLGFEQLAPAIRGVELHRKTFESTRQALGDLMIRQGVSGKDTAALLDTWFIQGDFLLCDFDQDFTHAVGNPPYVRQDMIPDVLMGEYRRRYSTIYDRADLYVPFIEQSLRLLGKGGKLGFICADRWMKNRYGQKLRELVSKTYHLATYIDMVGADAFHSQVSAYPAIIVIEHCTPGQTGNGTRVFARPDVNKNALGSLVRELALPKLKASSVVHEIDAIASGGEPWILEDLDVLALVRHLEAQFPRLEDAGCKVGIGVATGADKAFIGDFEGLEVEPCRKLPLVTTKDILKGHVQWGGKGVINPFGDDGKLVSLEDFPKLKRYLQERYQQIARRHVAKKAPHNWYRTIDRIDPALVDREKLLIPDIKGDASIVYESGKLYPHHNLYFITADAWDVHALQAVMRSGIARFFVSLYSTRMRGGYLRFQAQYLRRIRLPRWESVGEPVRECLRRCSDTNDRHELNGIVASLYDLSVDEMALMEGKMEGKVVQ
ncbi:Eco57I restriction-modification methylase domain-containing protein [Candidatus Synechococcus spongiarum]|uniref:site-specific DNA-methyltransferase (adenine-specific) n=1 Tax=Candidatus Synechococcus spongiarum TaxID=431041 RepID=A0A164YXA0_9SYNE|nr:Eco57I restriction-modification methylase domain-containing protein [Candidatus Synechococcus spongiarum]SAY38919.1 Modification methylase PaeR7I (EC 2.1.1.72) [Candidatus Synechococcus spongiarum]